jgi:hypothetical protein
VPTRQLALRDAEPVEVRPVVEPVALFRVHVPDQGRQRVGEEAHLLLARPQRRLAAASLLFGTGALPPQGGHRPRVPDDEGGEADDQRQDQERPAEGLVEPP